MYVKMYVHMVVAVLVTICFGVGIKEASSYSLSTTASSTTASYRRSYVDMVNIKSSSSSYTSKASKVNVKVNGRQSLSPSSSQSQSQSKRGRGSGMELHMGLSPLEEQDASPPEPTSRTTYKKLLKGFESGLKPLGRIITKNPLSLIAINSYSFFWNLPRKNLPYDHPWVLFQNSTAEWIQWYQIPHNLPPYTYVGTDHPADFFCYGLAGVSLPLGTLI